MIEGARASEYVDDNYVESYVYNDATVSYNFGESIVITSGINNVLNVRRLTTRTPTKRVAIATWSDAPSS